ncbi:MAG TPA: alpha-hydroxy acid oxidase [Steroidobacteraceae bacterium]
MTVITSVGDFRELARRKVPRAIFDYADRGSYEEITIRRNRTDLDALTLKQRVMVDASKQTLATTLAGQASALPLAIAPTGLTGLFRGNGEIHGARAAAAAGIPFCLGTLSILSIEQVRESTEVPFWFQLYLMRDRRFNADLMARAKAAQCPVLVLTLDLQVMGVRRRDAKNGLSVPPRLTIRNALDIATKPGWAFGVLTAKSRAFGNLKPLAGAADLKSLSAWVANQFDPSITWKDVAWVRERWPGKLILKGVLDADDARLAVDQGADAVIVSNHGGRQLDGACSTIAALPEVVRAVQGRCEVLFDGGVMSGQDVLKALALGARGCLIGKAYLYALAAQGQAGVAKAIEIIGNELKVSLALTGAIDVQNVSPSILR